MTHLYLEGNQIEDAGAEFIGQALRCNQSIEFLYLNNNRIGGTGMRKLATDMRENTSLKCVVVFNNLVPENVKEELKR